MHLNKRYENWLGWFFHGFFPVLLECAEGRDYGSFSELSYSNCV